MAAPSGVGAGCFWQLLRMHGGAEPAASAQHGGSPQASEGACVAESEGARCEPHDELADVDTHGANETVYVCAGLPDETDSADGGFEGVALSHHAETKQPECVDVDDGGVSVVDACDEYPDDWSPGAGQAIAEDRPFASVELSAQNLAQASSSSSGSSSSSSSSEEEHANIACSDGASLLTLLGPDGAADGDIAPAWPCCMEESTDTLGAAEHEFGVPQPWTPPEAPSRNHCCVELAAPRHRQVGPERSCLASAVARSSALKSRKRSTGAELQVAHVSFVSGAPLADLVRVPSYRAVDLWFKNPGAKVVCNWCRAVAPQFGGRLQGAEGRSQFAQTKFVCQACAELEATTPEASDEWHTDDGFPVGFGGSLNEGWQCPDAYVTNDASSCTWAAEDAEDWQDVAAHYDEHWSGELEHGGEWTW